MIHHHPLTIASILLPAILLLAACGEDDDTTPTPTTGAATTPASTAAPTVAPTASTATLTLTSDAFTNDGTLPVTHSCSGDGTSPALTWTGVPDGTQSFTLIVHDPDAPLAGGFAHWIVTDLPASATSLPAAVPAGVTIAGGGTQLAAFRGACPPVGAAAHHYHFRLYALDTVLGDAAGQTKDTVEAAMQTHILAETDLVGLFGRE